MLLVLVELVVAFFLFDLVCCIIDLPLRFILFRLYFRLLVPEILLLGLSLLLHLLLLAFAFFSLLFGFLPHLFLLIFILLCHDHALLCAMPPSIS